MKRRNLMAWLAAIAAILLVAVLLGGSGLGADSSVLSRGSAGWLAARRYLEQQGGGVDLLDRRLDGSAADGVLVVSFPWQRRLGSGELNGLIRHLQAGKTLVVAYSGMSIDDLHLSEELVLDTLQLDRVSVRDEPSLLPWRWWHYSSEQWIAEPVDDGLREAAALSMAAPRALPIPPMGARILYREQGSEQPVVFDYELFGGRVVVLPAGALANARILEPGNAGLLETLHAGLGPIWSFDEYHHGLSDPEAIVEGLPGFGLGLFTLHLLVIYLLGLLALGRRFGPAWEEVPVAAGSTAAFLRNLGALHQQLGHQRDAARLLVERARSLEPGLELSEETEQSVLDTENSAGLVKLAQEISRLQRRSRL